MRAIMRFARVSLALLFVVTVSAQTDSFRDALFGAIRRGAGADVERLLKAGAGANLVDTDGTSALMAATLFGNAQMLQVLIKAGADPNHAGVAGTTALMWAVPDVEKVKVLLDGGANVNAKSDSERTALLVAASYPRTVDLLRLLLDRGADLRAQDRAGATALALAVRSADVEVVRFLVEKGLDANALSVGARRVAFGRYDRPTVDFLMSKGLGSATDILVTAATWQPTATVARWIESGANVNASNPAQYGRTPLLTAVTSEAEGADTLKLLLDRGADPNARTTEGESPLDWAIYKGDRAKIELLEGRGREARQRSAPRRDRSARERRHRRSARVADEERGDDSLDVAPRFREKATCISCHHNAMPALAAATARRKGIEIDETRARKNLDDILTFFKSNAPRMMLGDPGGRRRSAHHGLRADGARGGRTSARHRHRDDDPLADRPPDAGWPLAWQWAQPSAV